MPSNKSPSYVNPGTGLPVGGGTAAATAVGDALKAHIEDAVGAHAASAISTVDGPAWANYATNPAADAQTQLDKIVTDLSSLVGLGGVSCIGSGDYNSTQGPWSLSADEFDTHIQQLLDGTNFAWYNAVVNSGANYPLGSNASILLVDSSLVQQKILLPGFPASWQGWRWYVFDVSGNSGNVPINVNRAAMAVYTVNGYAGNIDISKNYGQWVITCDGTNFYVQEMARPSAIATVSAGNTPYTVDALGVNDDLILVRSIAGARTVIFPNVSTCQGRTWHIVDASGTSHIFPITLLPTGGNINSYAGSITVGKPFGQWIVSCDGTEFYVQEMKAPTLQPPVVASNYVLDQSLLNEDVYADTSAGSFSITLPQYPSSHKNQKWFIYDHAGTAETNPLLIARWLGASYTINGIAGDFTARKNWGQWVITCDGTNYKIQELAPPVGSPYVVTAAVSPYYLDSRGYQDEEIFVNSTTGSRTIYLPQVPDDHKGQRWYIYDMTGNSETNNINITKHPSGTYNTNGNSAGLVVGSNYGKWVVTCDGFNFFVQVCKAPIGSPVYIPSPDTSPYQMDGRTGYQDELIFVDTSAQRTIYLPASPAAHKGQRWYVYDQTGSSELAGREILIQRNGGSFLINGYAGDTYLSSNFGVWMITCDGTNYFIS